MTNKMKRYAAFLLCFVMVFAAVPAMAAEGTASSGYGGFVLPEETTSGPTPAGPVLEDTYHFELTVGASKTYSFYGPENVNASGFFDSRPEMQVEQTVTPVPGATLSDGRQIYLYDVVFTAGNSYNDSIYPRNIVRFDGTSGELIPNLNWTLKVIANTSGTDLNPNSRMLNSSELVIYATIGEETTVSYYGVEYTGNIFSNIENVEIVKENKVKVPGAYFKQQFQVYLYTIKLKMTAAEDQWTQGQLHNTSNVLLFDSSKNAGTMPGNLKWYLRAGTGTATDNTTTETETEIETETTETETPDLSNVRLVITTNLDDPKRVRMGTEMVLTATIEGGEGLDFYIWWQSSTDGGETWTDIPGGVGDTYRETITRENSGMQWRACADLVAAEDAE